MCRQWRISLLWVIVFAYLNPDSYSQVKDTSFKMLWYKGKKVNDTVVFIPTGQTITFKPSNGKVEVKTPEKQDVLNSLNKELKRAEQRKAELNKLVISSPKGPLKVGLVYQLNEALDEVNSNYKELATNTIDLMVEKVPKNSKIPSHIQQAYNEVMDFVKKKSDISTPPVPPSMGFDYCYPCDAGRQALYQKESAEFTKWLEEERNNLEKAMKVIGYFGLRKVQNLYDPVADGPMEAEMFNAFGLIVRRLESKLLKAWNQFKGDETKLPFLAEQMLEFIRGQQLLGLTGNPDFPGALQIAATAVETCLNYLSKAKKEKDYKVLLNVRWIVALFRTAELLGMGSQQFEISLRDFIGINEFKVRVDASGKMGQEGTVLAAKMTGENIFSAVPDSTCHLKWTLISPDISKMKFNLDEATMQIPEATAEYVGTRSWYSYPANIQLDFCDEKKDTVFLHGFFPLDGEESWVVQGQRMTQMKSVQGIFSTCFLDVKRLKEMAADPNLEAKMIQQLKENQQKFQSTYQGAKNPGSMTPAEMQKMNEAMLASKNIMNTVQSASIYSFICKERLRNNQKTVFDGHVNGKELAGNNPAIQEAILKIKIEHLEK